MAQNVDLRQDTARVQRHARCLDADRIFEGHHVFALQYSLKNGLRTQLLLVYPMLCGNVDARQCLTTEVTVARYLLEAYLIAA